MTDKDTITLPREVACQVPLHELLAAVPADARLVIDDADGKGTRFIPVGRLCREAATALRTALAAEQPVPTDKDSLTVQSRLDAESFREERDEARALLNGVLQDIEALRRDAEQPRHPGYIIGNHWFETAYERLCAGEAEDAILEDYELVREPRLRDLRRDAERLRTASEKLFRKWSNAAPYHQWEPEMFEMELALYPPNAGDKT